MVWRHCCYKDVVCKRKDDKKSVVKNLVVVPDFVAVANLKFPIIAQWDKYLLELHFCCTFLFCDLMIDKFLANIFHFCSHFCKIL